MQSRYHISPQALLPCLPGAGILSAGSRRLAHRLQTCPYQLCALHCISQEAALHGPTAISQMLDLDFLLQGNKYVSPDLAKCAITLQVPHPSPAGAQKIRWMTKASEVRFFYITLSQKNDHITYMVQSPLLPSRDFFLCDPSWSEASQNRSSKIL